MFQLYLIVLAIVLPPPALSRNIVWPREEESQDTDPLVAYQTPPPVAYQTNSPPDNKPGGDTQEDDYDGNGERRGNFWSRIKTSTSTPGESASQESIGYYPNLDSDPQPQDEMSLNLYSPQYQADQELMQDPYQTQSQLSLASQIPPQQRSLGSDPNLYQADLELMQDPYQTQSKLSLASQIPPQQRSQLGSDPNLYHPQEPSTNPAESQGLDSISPPLTPTHHSSLELMERAAAGDYPPTNQVSNPPQSLSYAPQSYQDQMYAQASPAARPWYMPRRANCRSVQKMVKVQQCEPYTVETCWEEAKQECNPQPVTNCTGVVETKLEQVCYHVEEEVCTLVETVESLKSEDSYQVQDCFFGHEDEVCGVTYDIQIFDKDDYGCTDVEVLSCHQEAQYVHDINCIDSVEFDCKEDGMQENKYLPEIRCTGTPTHNCYKIPRKVYTEVCTVVNERFCESFSNNRPMPVERPLCKQYTKKTCDFKIETSPKISKEFSYVKDCKRKPREICEYIEITAVKPECETSERLSCKYTPYEHQCKQDPKHYCHMVEKVVEEEVCDTILGYNTY